jgi:hypothetical protein
MGLGGGPRDFNRGPRSAGQDGEKGGRRRSTSLSRRKENRGFTVPGSNLARDLLLKFLLI